MSQGNEIKQTGEEIVFKKLTFKEHLKAIGPGVIFVLTAMGAGDIVDSSVSGSHYGYDLMWVLAVAILVRFVIVNIMARFDMCNTEGITLLQGYGKLHRAFPWFFMIFSLFCGHMTNATMIKGSGTALFHITGFGSIFLWSCICVATGLFIAGKNAQRYLENVMKVLLAVMTVAFFGLAIASKPNPVSILKGCFGFAMPAGMGLFSATMIMLALIGSVAGSITNFLYPHSIRAKGWNDPTWKKVQRGDLLFSIIMMILMNLAIWVVGAEVLGKSGVQVTSLEDIANGMSGAFGPIGAIVLYLGVFGAVYSSMLGVASGWGAVVIESLQVLKPERLEQYGSVEADPAYKWASLFLLVTPVVWSLPGAPDFVALAVIHNVLTALGLPAIAIGLLFLATNKKMMGRFKNNIFENIVLVFTVALACWGAIKIVIGFFS
ncbi:MAG: Nramp family divalent metal transporter [Oscillospiraceae bacterium]